MVISIKLSKEKSIKRKHNKGCFWEECWKSWRKIRIKKNRPEDATRKKSREQNTVGQTLLGDKIDIVSVCVDCERDGGRRGLILVGLWYKVELEERRKIYSGERGCPYNAFISLSSLSINSFVLSNSPFKPWPCETDCRRKGKLLTMMDLFYRESNYCLFFFS